jgi:hypothetical protein
LIRFVLFLERLLFRASTFVKPSESNSTMGVGRRTKATFTPFIPARLYYVMLGHLSRDRVSRVCNGHVFSQRIHVSALDERYYLPLSVWTSALMDQVIGALDPADDFIAVTEAEEAMKHTAGRRAEEADGVRESLRGSESFVNAISTQLFTGSQPCLINSRRLVDQRPDLERCHLKLSIPRFCKSWRANRSH